MQVPVLLLEVVALVGGTLHTMEPAAPPAAATAPDAVGETADPAWAAPYVGTVLIEDGRLAAVGPDVEPPAGARTVDVTGKHLIPGLIDAFAYHDPDHDVLYVAGGVTLVRDAGNALTPILLQRLPAARDRAPGPALLVAGPVLDGMPPATADAVALASVDEVDDKLPSLIEMGLDYVSGYTGLDPDVWARAVEVTQAAGLAFWGPRPLDLTFDELLQAQPDGLFHVDGLLKGAQRWESVTLEELEPALDRFADAGIALTPTLAVYGERLVPPRGEASELQFLSHRYVRSWTAELEARRQILEHDPETFVRRGLAAIQMQGQVVRALHERGVRLVPGTASPHPWLLPGRSMLDELSLWRRAGFAEDEVLRLATIGAAEALRCADDRGSLTAGKVADVVVLADDPTEALETLGRPELVVLRGRVLDRAELDGLVDGLRERQAERRAVAEQPIEVHEPELPEGQVLLTGKVETHVGGERVSGERFAVVRQPDGTLAYCGRMRMLGGASSEDSELALIQRVRLHELVSFEMRMRTGRSMLVVDGEHGAEGIVVQRKLDGNLLDRSEVPGQVAFVETGSVTAQLILGHEVQAGLFQGLFFDGAEPAAGPWELKLDERNTHLCRSPSGDVVVRYDPLGFPEQIVRRQGAVIVETRTLEHQTFGGPGLPLPAGKEPLLKPRSKAPDPDDSESGRRIFGRPQTRPVEAGDRRDVVEPDDDARDDGS